MAAREARRRLREKFCSCGQGITHWGPHTEACPKFVDRSRSKAIIASLIEKRHNESEGEWLSLREFHRSDLFVMHLWGEWPDAKQSARTGLEMHKRFHRRIVYEVKISRSDFRNEIRRPQKRAEALAITHQFFFATPPGLVRRDEVPPECGLVEVTPGGAVKVVRHAPIRKPTQSFTMGDVVSLLRARHVGPSVWQIRDQARRAAALLKEREAEFERTQEMLRLARIRLVREKGDLLKAGSEWIGAWSAVPFQRRTDGEVRVRVTSVNVYDGYDARTDWARERTGTVYVKPVEKIEADGDEYGGTWMDPGDFLIAFRHVSEPAKVESPPDSSVHHRPRGKLVALDGGASDDDVF